MPIILEATYSKKLGLPNHGSHSYVVSLRTELTDIDQMPDESSRLYRMLQDAVDRVGVTEDEPVTEPELF